MGQEVVRTRVIFLEGGRNSDPGSDLVAKISQGRFPQVAAGWCFCIGLLLSERRLLTPDNERGEI